MSSPFRELRNFGNESVSSYETAWSSSFDKRSGSNLKMKKEYKDEEEEMEKNISTLENDISMMSVSSPKAFPTPKTKLKKDRIFSTPGSRILDEIHQEESRKLLRQTYPELFMSEGDEDEPSESPENDKQMKSEPISDEEDNFKENVPPERKTIKDEEGSRQNSEADDTFENYLRKLREVKKESPKRKIPERFIVGDDEEETSDDANAESSTSSESYECSSESEHDSDSNTQNRRLTSTKKEIPPKDDDEYFLQSLSQKCKLRRHPDSECFVKDGAMRMKKNREKLMDRLVDIYKRRCFSEVPSDMLKFEWNPRLRKSAGQCRNHRNNQSTIEMSTVVCTTAERVRDTLIHEMCHAAVWIVDKLHKEAHGPGWKKWAFRCMHEFRCLPVIERCHSYEIEAKFLYVCENEECQQTIKRQSKSLDTEKKICGKCKGRFVLYRFDRRTNKRVLVAGNPVTSNEPTASEKTSANAFSVYVKENYRRYNSSESKMKHAEIMEKLSRDYKLTKPSQSLLTQKI